MKYDQPADVSRTYLAKRICTGADGHYYEAVKAISIDPLAEKWPEPPPCRTCEGIPHFYARECTKCQRVFYRWFRFTLGNPLGLDACWECLVEWYYESHPRNLDMTPKMGFQAPPDSLLPKPRTMEDISADLDDLFAMLE